jgi:hypothetical protein
MELHVPHVLFVFDFYCCAAVFIIPVNCIGNVNVERSDLLDIRVGHCPSSERRYGKEFFSLIRQTGQINP